MWKEGKKGRVMKEKVKVRRGMGGDEENEGEQ